MNLAKIEGYDDAVKVFEANVSPRYRTLTTLEAWARGEQYAGLPSWFSVEKPLWERAPCITYLLTREAIESKVDLVLGEGRFPEITTSPGEGDPLDEADGKDAANAADQAGFAKKESALLDAFIARVLKQAGYEAAASEALFSGQEVSTAVLMFGIRNGKLFCDTTKAQWCEPKLDVEGNVLSLEIKYPYLDQYKDERGKWKIRTRLFRRVIDDKSDTTYKPAEASPYGIEPSWVVDSEQVYQHGFGFCPVVWYPFMRGCSAVNQIDGSAPHELLLDEIRAVDFALSQRHRAALFAGDPQWTECGVTPGFNPSAAARTAEMPGTPNGGPITPSNPPTAQWVQPDSKSQPARMKSPGSVWQYPNVLTKVELHTLPGDALKVVFDHASDLRMKVCEMLAHVPLDPDAVTHIRQLSAKALDALRRRELSRCDRIRRDFGDRCLIPSVQMMLRIVAKYAANGAKLNLAGVKRVASLLKRFDETDVSIRLVWGEYDDPDPEEEKQIVDTTVTAHEAGLITDRTAVAKVAAIFNIENVDEAVKALRAEKLQRQKDALAQTQAEQASLHALTNDDGAGTPGRGGKKKPASASSGRSGSAATADASA